VSDLPSPLTQEAPRPSDALPAAREWASLGDGVVACWLGRVAYRNAHAAQLSLLEGRARGAEPDTVLLVEHPPTVTCGRSAEAAELEAARQACRRHGAELVECERGGRLTFHGPGQAVAYPVVHLDAVGRDLHRWLWTLEEAVIRAVGRLGLAAGRRQDSRGVWVEGRKVASVGVAVRRWVSYHGVAINVQATWPEWRSVEWCGLGAGAYASLADFGVQVDLPKVGWAFAEELAELCRTADGNGSGPGRRER